MYTKQQLMQQLKSIGVNPKGTLKVHSSYKTIGEVEGRGDTVIDALMEYMRDGLLVLPTHTWEYVNVNNPVMDVLYTPSNVGILTNLFRKRENVYRSLHPTHSVAAVGKDAKEFVAGEEKVNTSCGHGGTYYKLWERDAQILLLGVNFNCNTFIHGMEEWDNHGKYTISKEQTDLYTINYQGQRLYTPQYCHCPRTRLDIFTKLEAPAIQEGILTLGFFGDATTRLMNAKPLRELTAKLLAKDDRYLLRC